MLQRLIPFCLLHKEKESLGKWNTWNYGNDSISTKVVLEALSQKSKRKKHDRGLSGSLPTVAACIFL